MLKVGLHFTRVVIASCTLVCFTPAYAQQKIDTIKIIVGYPPGGASDRAARLVGDALRERLGATVVVENKTGAGGRVAAQGFRATPANETTLMIGNPAVNVVAPHVFKNVGYDAL
ncbi:MAG: tripartite tricarboxylate transporter substrate-binding protein, partial [Burkholderiaceae bacterium]